MDSEVATLKESIEQALTECNDVSTLDLVYKLLVLSNTESRAD